MATIPNPAKSRTWDLGTSANGTFFDTEFNQLYANDNNLNGRVQTLEAGVLQYAKISDTKAANTAGGTFNSGADQTRTLNTEDSDTGSIVAISSNRFTPIAGTYIIQASAPGFGVETHQAFLYNQTAGADVSGCIGTSERSSAVDSVQSRSFVIGKFTANGTDAYEIRHRCSSSLATQGFGNPANLGRSEVYTIVELWKVG